MAYRLKTSVIHSGAVALNKVCPIANKIYLSYVQELYPLGAQLINDFFIIKTFNNNTGLGPVTGKRGKSDEDIHTRIQMGKQATRSCYSLLWNKCISQDTKKMTLNITVENILTYGAEVWLIPNKRKDT